MSATNVTRCVGIRTHEVLDSILTVFRLDEDSQPPLEELLMHLVFL